MPLTNGFDLLDFSTYGYLEWGFLALVAILIIVFIVLLIKASQKRLPASDKHRLVYKADNGESIIFSAKDAWYVNQNGLTEHYKSISDAPNNFKGKVVFLSKNVKKVTITQNQYEIIKRSANERQYVTFDFISKDEVKLGQRTFFTLEGQLERERNEHKRSKREQKSQLLADKKAQAIQKKADKRLKKEEKKAKKASNASDENFNE